MTPTRLAISLAVLAAAAPLFVASGPRAEGQRLRAQVFLTQQRIPGGLTERALLGFARRANTNRLYETTAEPIPQRKWLAEMILAFNAPPGDLEFHVLFYDTQDGPRRFVEDMTTLVNDRRQKTFVQRLRLERPRFRPNRRMDLVVTVRRQEVATRSFQLLGEEVRRTGEVNFTEEETRQRDD
ncbi:MAG: hypothetical protein NZ898_13885 [Myxococcota bacterium]|nr:hypothetical protein [Myxococcota bacterium]MDW8363903.1 hypothetical protein [Myxococcales bacterium]